MLAYRREADRGATDIAHFQWLSVQQLDGRLLPRRVPVVLTAHDVLPREPRPGQRAAQKRLYERVDQIVVHSEHGRSRLVSELGIDPARVTIIHHGAFTDLATLEPALPPGLERGKLPIAVLPGLMRPYKGLDLLLDAWRSFGDDPPGELWIVGKSKMPPPAAADLPSSVRLIDRFVSDAELAGVMRAADLVVLPYREIDQSGVLYAALGLGRPMLLTDVGGFPEVAATGAAELVAPNDAGALAEAINRLLGDEERRTVLGQMAASAAASTYSWDSAAGAHLRLYETLLANR
jgi:glycosyltransferase involved in cell wall biosynthesis